MQGVKRILYSTDLFANADFLRYKGKCDSRTLTGGFLSILILGFIGALFINKLVIVFQMNQITTTQTISQSTQTTPLYVTTPFFMIGISTLNFNLNNSTSRVLDFYFEDKNGRYQLEACTESHWAASSRIQQSFNFFNMSQWKCLPLNITFSPAPIFYSYRILINKCDPKSAGCMANDIFKNLGIDSSVLKINVLNTVINPTAEVYQVKYMKSDNSIFLTNSQTVTASLQFADYTVTTDNGLFLFNDYTVTTGISLASNMQTTQNSKYDNISLGIIQITHSLQSNVYTRKFYKIDDVLSYVGGLFNTLIAILAITKFYSQDAFECIVGSRLFFSKPELLSLGQKIKKFNIFSWIVQKFRLLACFKQDDTILLRNKIRQQLDIVYLLQRIYFLQKIVFSLFDDYELSGMMIYRYITLQQLEERSRKHQLSSNYEMQVKSKIKNYYTNKSRQTTSQIRELYSQNQNRANSYASNQRKKQNKIVNNDLHRLKMSADQGNQRSKKIWNDLLKETIRLMRQQRQKEDPLDNLCYSTHKDQEDAIYILLNMQEIEQLHTNQSLQRISQ